MASIYDRVDSILKQVERRVLHRGHDLLQKTQEQVRFLSVFVECIVKWSDAEEVVPDSGTLVIKIEAAVQEMENQLFMQSKATAEEVEKLSRSWTYGTPQVRITPYERMKPKWLDLLANLNKMINSLKPEIGEKCDILISRHSFVSHSVILDSACWKKFFPCLEYIAKHYEFADPRRNQVESLYEKLMWIKDFLDDGLSMNPRFQDFMIHLQNSSFRTAFLACQWWSKEFDPNLKEEIFIAFSHLQREICFTNPAKAEIFLRQLQTFKGTRHKTTLTKFVQFLLTFEVPETEYNSLVSANKYILLNTLRNEVHSLLTSFMNIPEDDAESVQKFLPDVTVLVVELASLKESLRRVNANATLVLKLLVKMWHLRADIILSGQLSSANILQLSVKKQINDLTDGVRKIKELEEGNTENVNQMMRLMEEVTKAVGSADYTGGDKDITREIAKLLLKILLFKAESSFVKLHDSNDVLMVPVKDGLESLHEGLKILMTSVINQPGNTIKDGKPEYARIEAVARRVISLCDSCLSQFITEEMIKNVNLLLSVLLDEIKIILAELKETYFQIPRSNFPKIGSAGFIDSLLGKLRVSLNYKANLFVHVQQPTEEILGVLVFFRHFLGDILEQDIEIQELKDLSGRVIHVAYEVEYLIDSIVGDNKVEWHHMFRIYLSLQDIRLLKIQVTRVREKKANDAKVQNAPKTSRHMVTRATCPRVDEAIVGLNDEEEMIIDRLLANYPKRDTISIVGMPGIGKTTLAKKVYNSPKVVYHFHIRAWGCVSEVYRKRDLLLEILSHIAAITNEILEMTQEDLEFKLYKLLKQKRYLVVLDDMWNKEAWDDLGRLFPNDGNGSRILITSRLLDVALEAKGRSDPYSLRLLPDVESWKLLQMKIFREERCPMDLMGIGLQIAEGCKGLPLAIVTMAGLLERTDRQQNCWKQIAEDLSSRIVDDPQEQCRKILELSYKHLPDSLKACFLYFGAFLEDESIPARKLMQLWIAEGFVQKTGLKTLEDLAEDYLMDLIGRSLVLIAQQRSRGGVRACRIHDMLRHLCQSKAKEEQFLHVITRFNMQDDSFDDLDYGLDIDYTVSSDSLTYENHRLCFCLQRRHFVQARPFGPHVRSLLFFATNDMYPRCAYDITFISLSFKLLKVLDLECINMGTSFFNGIEVLVHLRYLAATADIDSLPSSIGKLWNLETFVLKGLKGMVKLPYSFWCLAKLRHVRVSNVAIFSLRDEILGDCSKLGNLVTLSSPFLCYGRDASYILKQVPNLRKLRCLIRESWDNCQNCYQFPRLDVLTQLESLKASYSGRATLRPREFSFPLNLRKLTLSNFRLPWSHISVIGSLPNLEVLKLLSKTFEGEIWDMEEGQFGELKFLKLDNLNIVKWNASSDHLPKLEQLVLRCCMHLEEIPYCFVEMDTLQLIEVQWCGDSVEESVREIKKEADEGLKVIINFSDLDSRSSS